MYNEPTRQGGLTRRDVLRRGGVVGGALLWTAPVVQAIRVPSALAATTGSPPPPTDVCGVTLARNGPFCGRATRIRVNYTASWSGCGAYDTVRFRLSACGRDLGAQISRGWTSEPEGRVSRGFNLPSELGGQTCQLAAQVELLSDGSVVAAASEIATVAIPDCDDG